MANPPSDLFVDGDGQLIEDGDLVQSIEGGFNKVRVRYGRRGETDVLVFTVPRIFSPETDHEWFLDREEFHKSYWRRVGILGRKADVVVTDGLESTGSDDSTLVIKPGHGYAPPQFVYTAPMPASKAGSKGYQRRQNQRWPKGR